MNQNLTMNDLDMSNAVDVAIKSKMQAQYTLPVMGRVAGVLGAVAQSGMNMHKQGIKPSNVLGLAIGGFVGYAAGSGVDIATTVMRAWGGEDRNNYIGYLAAFGIGYGASAGVSAIGRCFEIKGKSGEHDVIILGRPTTDATTIANEEAI